MRVMLLGALVLASAALAEESAAEISKKSRDRGALNLVGLTAELKLVTTGADGKAKEQVLTSVRRIDEYRGILHSRRHLAASPVFKGIPNFRETRIAMLRAETVDELFAILERAREAVRQVTD